MKSVEQLELQYLNQLAKALRHLEYSLEKVKKLPTRLEENDEETLETWESFSSRFARVVDIFLTKYLKLKVRKEDPGFDGTLKDHLNMAEKMNLILSADRWLALRELRNIQAHDYTEQELDRFLTSIRNECDFLLSQLREYKSAPAEP